MRITKKKKVRIARDTGRLLGGELHARPMLRHTHVNKAVDGAGILGSRLKVNSHTEHHGRRTVPLVPKLRAEPYRSARIEEKRLKFEAPGAYWGASSSKI